MRVLKLFGIAFLALIVALTVTVAGSYISSVRESDTYQADVQPFYNLPNPAPNVPPGTLIRTEPITNIPFNLTGASAYRMLYMSQDNKGNPRISSGMFFVPTSASKGPRPVVAYAHGTSGFGDACAPSRSESSAKSLPWIQTMMNNGWVMTATDYVGIGTEGEPFFLIGQSEANDVVNSVRAVRNFTDADAGDRYAVMGHSQGGHSALWTGELSKQIAPELKLVGVAASAPAADLEGLVNMSWNIPNAWGLGPDVLVSWPTVYPQLNADQVATQLGMEDFQKLAYECVENTLLQGEFESLLGRQLFGTNPTTLPAWQQIIAEQTPTPYPADMPLSISASVQDGVVFAKTTAELRDQWCAAGANLQMTWLGDLASGPLANLQAHTDTILTAWPEMTMWMQQRFQGIPATNNCTATNPVIPGTGAVSQ